VVCLITVTSKVLNQQSTPGLRYSWWACDRVCVCVQSPGDSSGSVGRVTMILVETTDGLRLGREFVRHLNRS